ncbi:hypothetical protein [Xanthobacter autotrophicus]|uniref:hypothetical protein n=1 Tax=Xanthobacter autotrophicus TaxID=280 RepID=UPI00372C63FB
MLQFLRRLRRPWSTMAVSSQHAAAFAAHRARYDLFRTLGFPHDAALRRASGDE